MKQDKATPKKPFVSVDAGPPVECQSPQSVNIKGYFHFLFFFPQFGVQSSAIPLHSPTNVFQ